jgi:uncharacterized protein YcnI
MTDRTRPLRRRTPTLRAIAPVLVVAAVLVALAAPAGAHVDAEASTDGTGVTRIELSFSHGCEGEPTTTLRARSPEGATDVVAEEAPGWTSSVDGDQVTWTGGSVPDGQAASFAFTARLAQAEGTEVPVPVIQQCPTLANEWIEPPTDDTSEASSPAPVVAVPAGAGGQATAAEQPTPDPTAGDPTDGDEPITALDAEASQALPEGAGDPSAAEQAQASADDESAAAGGTAGLIVFLVVMAILIGGAGLLYLRNRRPRPPTS